MVPGAPARRGQVLVSGTCLMQPGVRMSIFCAGMFLRTFAQYSLRLAYATTIRKAQGLTLDAAYLAAGRESSGGRALRARRSWAQVVRAVEALRGQKREQFAGRHGDPGRALGLYVARRCRGLTLSDCRAPAHGQPRLFGLVAPASGTCLIGGPAAGLGNPRRHDNLIN
jgi:hypothetical protein